jgi:hypothetical protein
METDSAKPIEVGELLLRPADQHHCTEKFYLFAQRHYSIFDLFFFSVSLATNADRVQKIVVEAIAKYDDLEASGTLKDAKDSNDRAFKKLQSFGGLQSENLCIRLTDNFLCYISECIQMCMVQRPELLRSNELVKVEDVLKFTSYDDLISFLVDKKLNELTYGGIKEISAFLTERTGFELFLDEHERALLSLGVELRNIYTHNRGLVNDLFLKRTANARQLLPSWEFRKGVRFHADLDEVSAIANNMYRIAARIDDQAIQKFKLKKKSFAAWKTPKEIETAEYEYPEGRG